MDPSAAYYEYEISSRFWSCVQKEIALAVMAGRGFEGFVEHEDVIQAYIGAEQHTNILLGQIGQKLATLGIDLQYTGRKGQVRNWNEAWEKKIEPVTINGSVRVRAPFHDPAYDLPLTVIIEPKMSFGTGHHASTKLMILEMLRHPLKGRKVLDAGCGTGILGILASLSGAWRVVALDTDHWAYTNAVENVERNRALGVEVLHGEVGTVKNEQFGMVLANINRNTLVQEMQAYAIRLEDQGILIVSGFQVTDATHIREAALRSGLKEEHTGKESNWISLSFVKQQVLPASP